jgi:serine protease inhibitor ecotin
MRTVPIVLTLPLDTEAVPDQIPVFQYVPEEGEVRARVWRSVEGLVAPLIVVALAGGFLIGRYRPVG